MKRIVTGIQPTNDLTLGNYFGAIQTLVQNLNNEDELLLFIADLHSCTLGNFDINNLAKYKQNILKYYLAAGLDLDNVYIFNQSEILQTTNLAHILTCCSTIGELSRMTQFKDKSQKVLKQDNGTQMIPTGLLIYPTLMAADILIFNANLVIVGSDQKQHLELTRNLAEKLNKKAKTKLFNIPEIYTSKISARIMDLQNPAVKMSKSAEDKKGVIFLNDEISVSIKKIKSAKTDCDNTVKYDPENKPGVSNLISIYSSLTNKSIDEIQKQFQNRDYAYFKNEICFELEKFLKDFQAKFNAISNEQIDKVLLKGKQKANLIATDVLNNVYERLGFK